MSRSKWKLTTTKNNITQTNARNLTILPEHINKTINIYNGLKYSKLIISKDMVGHKLGEYAGTRKKNNNKK